MQKRPVITAAFHKKKFDELILILLKTDGEIDQLFFAIIKEKFRELLTFAGNDLKPQSVLMRRAFMHTQISATLSVQECTGSNLDLEKGTAPVSKTDISKFCACRQLLRPER